MSEVCKLHSNGGFYDSTETCCICQELRLRDQRIAELEAAAAEVERAEPVALSKNGNLFWCGDPTEFRGVDCDLYRHPPSAPEAETGYTLPLSL